MNPIHRVALVAALVLGCSGDGGGTGPCGSGGTATSVSVCDNFFAPSSSPIVTGNMVTWTWRGANPHTVTFEDSQGSSGTPKSSGSHSRTFLTAGTFRYRCLVHSTDFNTGMIGSVSVP